MKYTTNKGEEIDLSPEPDTEIDLSVEEQRSFIVERSANGGARCKGLLMRGMGEIGDALEALLVSLTAAGAPVHLPEFREAVFSACEGVANNLDDYLPLETRELMERKMADYGVDIILEPDEEDSAVAQWMLSGPSSVIDPLLPHLHHYAWSTRDEALMAFMDAVTELRTEDKTDG